MDDSLKSSSDEKHLWMYGLRRGAQLDVGTFQASEDEVAAVTSEFTRDYPGVLEVRKVTGPGGIDELVGRLATWDPMDFLAPEMLSVIGSVAIGMGETALYLYVIEPGNPADITADRVRTGLVRANSREAEQLFKRVADSHPGLMSMWRADRAPTDRIDAVRGFVWTGILDYHAIKDEDLCDDEELFSVD